MRILNHTLKPFGHDTINMEEDGDAGWPLFWHTLPVMMSGLSLPEKSKAPKPVAILGVPVHPVTTAEVLALVTDWMGDARLHQIATVNPEFVMKAQADPDFFRVLTEADLCIPDGIGLLWAGRYLGRPIPERVAGSDLVYQIAGLAAVNGWPLFLLGAAPGVAEEAARILKGLYPGLIIAGCYAGSPDPAENEAIVRLINASQAELLYVAYGAPRQDNWITRNRESLPCVRLALGVGGSLDFITGRSVRAPQWLQRLGLEWLHRLIHEPWRWRRMLALPRFVLAVISQRRGR